MQLSEQDREAVLALTDEDSTHELEDGRTIRLKIEPDEGFDPFEQFDCYGRIEWVNDRTGYHEQRPDGFTGNAEKLQASRSDRVWWEPPTDGPKRTDPEFKRMRNNVLQLLEFGMYVIGLELLDGTDHYRRPIVIDAEWIGGIEPFGWNEYPTELIGDLLDELAERN